jgi:magnesium-transporting ATPase (P-type)
MITGDHIATAKKVALNAGLIKEEEMEIEGVALTGA